VAHQSPAKQGTTIESTNQANKVSPKGNHVRANSRESSVSRLNQGTGGMNPILKSPQKNHMAKQPVRNGQGSAKHMNGAKFNGIVVNGSASGK